MSHPCLPSTAPSERSPDAVRRRSTRRPRGRLVRRATGAVAALGLAALAAAAGPSSGLPTAAAATAPETAASATTAASGCTLGAKLVPTCGVLWGAAPNVATSSGTQDATKDIEVPRFEKLQGRPLDIVHGYHTNDDRFPNPYEVAVATDPTTPRLLLLNWRPAMDTTWAAAANGAIDARIDAEAARLKAFGRPIMLAIWHEPEHFVKPTAGSGMTASDYRAMVRHVILRLKAKGATNAVFVQIYQGYPSYAIQPWWPQMYPGDDVIDWIGSDSYNSGNPTGYNSGDFSTMVNRTLDGWKGWYRWATTNHPGKPLMLGEWGVWYNPQYPTRMAWFYQNVQSTLKNYPALKAMSYYNAIYGYAKGTTRIDATASSLSAYRALSASLPRVDIGTAR